MSHYLVKEISHYCNVTLKHCSGMTEHIIPYYDFTFVLEGTLTYHVNGRKIVLTGNDAIFLPPGTLRSREAWEDTVSFVSFNFHAFEDVVFPFPVFMQDCINANIRKLTSLYPHSHLTSFFHSREKCASMLNYILFELLDAESFGSNNEHVVRILNYIEAHITEKLTLSGICSKISLSREYTSYIFKKETGKTLTSYINERKILLAKELIRKEEMSLADIALYLGYDNYNYFSRLFKTYQGITPAAVRHKQHTDR